MKERITVDIVVNGVKLRTEVPSDLTLLRFLRDELKLTGTKEGCSTNHCGACMVLVNGRARKSCLLKMSKLQDAEVLTIEGLGGGPAGMHPVKAAFLAAGAVQCGFCTPGMIIATKALLDSTPAPSEDEIRRGLKGNICRCTGYNKIIDAVKLAARWLKDPAEMKMEINGGYGRSVIDLDGREKVEGALAFADDIYMDGMLYGKVVWSEHPHALIKEIDTSEAEKLPGVFRVLTAEDVPGHNGFGPLKQDQPIFCRDKVRFVGDSLALVLAEDAKTAREGADLVKVTYEPLPGVFTPQEGLKEGAPQVSSEGNICKHLTHIVGDVEKAFAGADLIVEGHFETPFVEHAYLEPEAGVAYWEGDTIVLKVPTQFPFELRKQLEQIISMPEEKIRVQATPLGGAFGSKADATIEPLLAVAAYCCKRPVKITLSRKESFIRSTKRHPYIMDYRVSFDREGKIVAVDAELLSDAGAYTNLSPRVIDQACIFSCGPYEVPNLRVEGWAVYTNNVNSSAFRGFGINQAAFAIESLVDEAAYKLGLDPFEIRHKNALKEGSRTSSGEILRRSVAMEETIKAAAQACREELYAVRELEAAGKKIGIGVAAGFKNVGAGKGKVDDAGAVFTLLPGGKVLLRASAVDMGQGIRTTLVQVARQVLSLRDGTLELITGDTTLTPKHGGAIAERQTLISGNAVAKAAKIFRAEILAKSAGIMSVTVEELELVRDVVAHEPSGRGMALSELEEKLSTGEKIEASYIYVAPKTFALSDVEGRKSVSEEEYRNYPGYAYTCQAAVIELDPESGEVKVLKVIAAHDVGKAINPQKIEGQIEGSCLMAQGYALSEQYVMEQGIPKTRSLLDLGLPSITDAPPVRTLIVEKPDITGPFGAKGISEVATVPLTPAIINAIYDACGVRIYDLPAIPGKILLALKNKGKGEK